MKPKTIIPLVIGLGVGFFAIKMGMDMVQKAKGAQEDKTMVFVASKSIESATGITEQMISGKSVPLSLIPPDAFTDKKSLVGRVTKMPVAPGVPITRAMLAPPGAQPGLAAQIPSGHRAVSVKVNEETAVAGFITPGARVDVSAVYGRGVAQSRDILTNVEVGAVGQSLSAIGADGKKTQIAKTVTLFLKPEEVQQLNAASGAAKGGLRLALRGHSKDPGESFFSKLMKKALTPAEPAPVVVEEKKIVMAKAEPPKTHVVEVRRGDNVEQLVFDETGGVQHRQISGPNGAVGAPRDNPAHSEHGDNPAPSEDYNVNPEHMESVE